MIFSRSFSVYQRCYKASLFSFLRFVPLISSRFCDYFLGFSFLGPSFLGLKSYVLGLSFLDTRFKDVVDYLVNILIGHYITPAVQVIQ